MSNHTTLRTYLHEGPHHPVCQEKVIATRRKGRDYCMVWTFASLRKEDQSMTSSNCGTVTLRAFGWPSLRENAAPRACRVKPHPFGTAAGVFTFCSSLDDSAPHLQYRNLTSAAVNPRLCPKDDRHTGISTLDEAARISPLVSNWRL